MAGVGGRRRNSRKFRFQLSSLANGRYGIPDHEFESLMPARNVNLTERLAAFVDQQVHSGRHQNASEVVREALRRYERDLISERDHAEAVQAIRKAFEASASATLTSREDLEIVLAQLVRRLPDHSTTMRGTHRQPAIVE